MMAWTKEQDAIAEKIQDVVGDALAESGIDFIDISHGEWSAIVSGLARIQAGATVACGQFRDPKRQEQAADAVRYAFLELLKDAQKQFDAQAGHA